MCTRVRYRLLYQPRDPSNARGALLRYVNNWPFFASDSRQRTDSLSRPDPPDRAPHFHSIQQKFVIETPRTLLPELSEDGSRLREAFSIVFGGATEIFGRGECQSSILGFGPPETPRRKRHNLPYGMQLPRSYRSNRL
jgi:hypothetical protein